MNRLVIPSLIASLALAGGMVTTTSLAAPKQENVKAGQFCKKSDRGRTRTSDNGDRVRCTMKGGRYRWVVQ